MHPTHKLIYSDFFGTSVALGFTPVYFLRAPTVGRYDPAVFGEERAVIRVRGKKREWVPDVSDVWDQIAKGATSAHFEVLGLCGCPDSIQAHSLPAYTNGWRLDGVETARTWQGPPSDETLKHFDPIRRRPGVAV